ncbi:unnamed protein product, partial [Amoebophrya sp. A120]
TNSRLPLKRRLEAFNQKFGRVDPVPGVSEDHDITREEVVACVVKLFRKSQHAALPVVDQFLLSAAMLTRHLKTP